MDLRGYGGRKQDAGDFTMEEAAADAVALADELGWDRFSLIGHSMSGQAIQHVLLAEPGRVQRLVALNPVPATGVPFDEDGWALFSGAAASRDNRFAIINFTTGGRLPAAFVDHVVQHSLDHSTTEAFGAYLESWGKTDFSERVKGNPAAVKVIVGEHDPALWRAGDGADLAAVLSRRRARGDAERRALPDVRDPGGAGRVHRGIPGPGLTAMTATARPDTEVVFDPATYTEGVPFGALARLRRDSPVVWVDEIPVLGWPAGPGFWLVLRHADVGSVMRQPQLFSSWLGATQIRDPVTPAALGYVRGMMLNMDPPAHSRLRTLLARSFTPRAVARIDERIRGHARALCERAFAGRGGRGECDFAKDVAADLPLLTLADVLGMPEQDRWLLFDWSNRVIGYQDPDYAASAAFDPSGGTPMAAEALALRPVPDASGRMPDPRTRDGMPDLYAYAHLLADAKRRRPGDDVMSILLAQVDDDGGRVSVEEFENMFWLFAVAGNETIRNGLPGRMHRAARAPARRRTRCAPIPG